MTISFPLSLPSTNFKRLNLRCSTQVAVTRSPFTFATQVYTWKGAIWIAEVTLPIMDRQTAEYWNCFLLQLNGPAGTFLLGDPSAKTPRGVASGSPVVNGANQSGLTLSTRGWTAGTTNILRAGDYLQIGNNLYKNLKDVNSDGSGIAALDIWPRLRSSTIADGTTIIVNNTVGIFRLLQNDFQIYSVDESKNYEVFFTAVESI